MTNLQQPDPMMIRMARAIAMSEGSSDWEHFLPAARASLTALREPSEEMLEAASTGLPDWGDLPEGWRAMIDYVLGDDEKPFNDNVTVEPAAKAAS
jgi:hypothetical protein